ncbi:MAG: hypothetical protein M1822_000233 [Bathelium mastoideum]|nr:MAG: hypothetical protein M1822_000233 [Bathelium mastoideum]
MTRGHGLSVQSAPEAVTMSRMPSTFGAADDHFSLDANSATVGGDWYNSHPSNYTFEPTAQHPSSYETGVQPATNQVNVNVYDPSDYLLTISEDSCLDGVQNDMLYSRRWGFNGDLSPDTPTSTELCSDSSSTSQLSRQSSVVTNSLSDNLDLCRIQSNLSFSDGPDSSPISCSPPDKDNSSTITLSESQRSHFLRHFHFISDEASNASRDFPFDVHAHPSFLSQQSLEEMDRTLSEESNASQMLSSNRAQRRRQELIAQGERKIAPKSEHEVEASQKSSDHKVVRIESQDGTAKQVAAIKKQPYVRPHHPKIMCPHCNEKPDGFRGEHELRRHTDRVHALMRKVWITVDVSPDKKFLANCKACTGGKRYGVYYNAAAHLRRAHFNPRKRGRKGKGDEKRGGKAGGDQPPMEWLRQQGWLREIEELVPAKITKQTLQKSDEEQEEEEDEDGSPKMEATPSQHCFEKPPAAEPELADLQQFDPMSAMSWYGQLPSDDSFNSLDGMLFDPSLTDPALNSNQAFAAPIQNHFSMFNVNMPYASDSNNLAVNMSDQLLYNGQQWKSENLAT